MNNNEAIVKDFVKFQFPCKVKLSQKWIDAFQLSKYSKTNRSGLAISRGHKRTNVITVIWDNAKGKKCLHESFLEPIM